MGYGVNWGDGERMWDWSWPDDADGRVKPGHDGVGGCVVPDCSSIVITGSGAVIRAVTVNVIHADVATDLNNLATLYQATNRRAETELGDV